MKVKIDNIQFDKDLYPRFEADNATVNQYRDCIEKLPPILVTKGLVLIDGYHRLLANKLEGSTEIEVEIFNGDDPKRSEMLLEAIQRNSLHGKQLSQKEKRENARRLWEFGLKDTEKIASCLSVTPRIVNDWTEKLREADNEKRDAEILDLYLQCFPFEFISNKLQVSKDTIHRVFENGKFSKIEQPEDLQYYNTWNCSRLALEQLKYPGQTPQNLIENIVFYFSDPPQLKPLKLAKVVDPMAGSGVVRDVCLNLLRRYMLFDLKPLREDIPIRQNDILQGFPKEAGNADLVYFDPPYFNLMDEYPLNGFTKDYPSFLNSMEKSLSNIKRILSENGKVALILKPMNEKMLEGKWLDLTFDTIAIAKKLRYQIVKRIAAPLSTQQFNQNHVQQAKEKRRLLNTHRDIVILEID